MLLRRSAARRNTWRARAARRRTTAGQRHLPHGRRMVQHGRDRIREGDRHQGWADAEGFGRVLRHRRRGKSQPEARYLVRRHGRPAFAGGGAGPDHRRTSRRCSISSSRGPRSRPSSPVTRPWDLPGRARHGLQHRAGGEEESTGSPACWKDLGKPDYKGDLQMANPNASGTAYTTIATLVQVFGEDEAFKMLKDWNKNISNYSRQGVGPIKATARGENMVAVAFIHDVVTEAQAGFPVKVIAPCEGTGYEIGSMSLIKGARNLDNAKKFYDWALTPAAQKLSYESKSSFQLPSNVAHAGVAAVAEPGRHQAHRLQLRQVWLVGGAQAPARKVGQGSRRRRHDQVTRSVQERPAAGRAATWKRPTSSRDERSEIRDPICGNCEYAQNSFAASACAGATTSLVPGAVA